MKIQLKTTVDRAMRTQMLHAQTLTIEIDVDDIPQINEIRAAAVEDARKSVVTACNQNTDSTVSSFDYLAGFECCDDQWDKQLEAYSAELLSST